MKILTWHSWINYMNCWITKRCYMCTQWVLGDFKSVRSMFLCYTHTTNMFIIGKFYCTWQTVVDQFAYLRSTTQFPSWDSNTQDHSLEFEFWDLHNWNQAIQKKCCICIQILPTTKASYKQPISSQLINIPLWGLKQINNHLCFWSKMLSHCYVHSFNTILYWSTSQRLTSQHHYAVLCETGRP